MNEIISESNCNGKLINVDEYHCRKDAYYWPLSIVDEKSLIDCMNFYCINKDKIKSLKREARNYATNHLDIRFVKKELENIINDIYKNKEIILNNNRNIFKPKDTNYINAKKIIASKIIPDRVSSFIRTNKEKARYRNK